MPFKEFGKPLQRFTIDRYYKKNSNWGIIRIQIFQNRKIEGKVIIIFQKLHIIIQSFIIWKINLFLCSFLNLASLCSSCLNMGQNPSLYFKKSVVTSCIQLFRTENVIKCGLTFILWNIFLYLRKSEKEEKHYCIIMPLLLNFI